MEIFSKNVTASSPGFWGAYLAPIKSKVVKLLQKLNVTITNEELASALEVSSKL